MRRVPWTAAGLALVLAALVLPAAQPNRKPSEAEAKAADLKALNERIERQQSQLKKDAVETARLNRLLQDAERAASRANGDLNALRAQRAQRAASRKQLVEERTKRQAEREAVEADLASQLRAAYFMGRNEPLKLLLNQRNPAEVGRNLTYYGYLGRMRAGQINIITDNIARIDELTVKIDAEGAELALLEARQKGKLVELESAQRDRSKVLAVQKEGFRDRTVALNRMQDQKQQLEQLLKELSRRAAEAQPAPGTGFGQSLGKLPWPVAGRIVTNFRAPLAGGLPSDGINVDAPRGTEVRAVHKGTVMFADYMKGRGNVVILYHGDGYWTLYAHNEELFKAEDAEVAAGETIATVGDTGGRPRPGLYFELRRVTTKSGKTMSEPLDPRKWFRTKAPPPN